MSSLVKYILYRQYNEWMSLIFSELCEFNSLEVNYVCTTTFPPFFIEVFGSMVLFAKFVHSSKGLHKGKTATE